MTKLRVMTFNVWGTPNASERLARMRGIGQEIISKSLDIVGLQETWDTTGRQILIDEAKTGGLSYSHYFHSGIVGSGLLLLSRYPILDAFFYRFRLGGKPEKIWHADYYAGKGVGFTRLQTPFGLLDVYNIHAVAQFTQDDDKDEYKGYRTAGIYECVRFVARQSSTDIPSIILGDFNIQPDQLAYRVIRSLGQFIDCYATLNPKKLGATYTPDNPYVKQEYPNWNEPQRLDYIFIKRGSNFNLKPISATLSMQVNSGIKNSSFKAYSDHLSVFTVFSITEFIEDSNLSSNIDPDELENVLSELADLLTSTVTEIEALRSAHLNQVLAAIPCVLVLSALITQFTTREIQPRRFFLRLLIFSILSLITLLMSLYPIIMVWLSLFIRPDEIQALKAVLSEVKLQIKAKKTFNDIAW